MWAERTPKSSSDSPQGSANAPVSTPKLVLGLCVLTVGVLLTIDNLDLADTRWLLRFWPAGLIAVGLAAWFAAGKGSSRGGPLLLILLGSWLSLDRLDIIDVNPFALFWPTVLIVAGGSLIMQTLRRRQAPVDDDASVSSFAFMGAVKRASNASRFQHSDLNAMWGGCELDLREATIPSGAEASVDVFALMGGHKIQVPKGWIVDTRVFPFMGGVDDKTGPASGADAPRLVIRGTVIMGGLHIEH